MKLYFHRAQLYLITETSLDQVKMHADVFLFTVLWNQIENHSILLLCLLKTRIFTNLQKSEKRYLTIETYLHVSIDEDEDNNVHFK